MRFNGKPCWNLHICKERPLTIWSGVFLLVAKSCKKLQKVAKSCKELKFAVLCLFLQNFVKICINNVEICKYYPRKDPIV